MCIHELAVATYDASEVFCDICDQRWKVDDILRIAEVAINAAQQSVQADNAKLCARCSIKIGDECYCGECWRA